MSGGFWAGAVPPWAYVVGACLVILGILLGVWAGYGRGFKHAEEEARWAREQAKARRTYPVYRHPPEAVHEVPLLTSLDSEDWNGPWLPPDETVLYPTALLTPADLSWTGEIQRMTAAFEEDMARIMGGTDEQLREITR